MVFTYGVSRPSETSAPPLTSTDEAIERLDAILEDSVRVHQRSDVPYGMFLSGGIDSAAILALMARLNDQPVLAYTAGFDAAGAADERQAAGVRLLHQRVQTVHLSGGGQVM